MSSGIKYIPLTFVNTATEKERLIRNTILLRHFASQSNGEVALSYYIEGTQYGFNAPAKDSGTHRYVRISDISNGEIAWDTVPFCDCDDPENYLLRKDDIVVARTGGTTGKSYLVSTAPAGVIYAGYLIRVRANANTNPLFLSVFLNSYLYWSQITSLNRDEFRPSVNAEKLKALRLPKFDRALQDQIIRLSNDPSGSVDSSIRAELDSALQMRNRHELVVAEIEHMASLLAKLKQAILQEAIQGKLTADWRAAHPNVESASQLLQRIQAEKARLIAAKKLRPEKSLPKITANEIPFETPSGWEWARLGDVCEKTGSGSTPSGGKTAYSTTGTPFLRSQNVHNSGLVLDGVAYISTAIHASMKGTTVYPQDILLNITGGSIGRCALVSNEIEEANVNQHVAIIRPLLRSSGSFLHSVILSPYFQNKVDEAQTGAGREGLPKNKMDRILIPLPSLAEQAAIMEKVEALMMICRALEVEIEHSRTHAAQLLQAVLREAFSDKLVAQNENDKPAPVESNVIPFPVRIANISATDLHAGILAMAYQHHERSPKHLVYFGHVKAEKIAHMVEAHLGIDLERVPVKAAAGPNDYPHLKKVESRAQKAKWFVVRQQQADGAYVFHKQQGFDALLDRTAAALGERAAEVDALINLLLPLNTRQAEIVATLYAAWNNLLLLGRAPSDEEIVYEARENWHASKLEIAREKFFKGLEWIRKQGLVPAGRGRYVDTK